MGKTKNTPSEKHPTASVGIGNRPTSDDPMRQKIEEILREKEQVLIKPKAKLFDAQVAPGEDHFSWMTQLLCEFFNVSPGGFKSNVTAWNYPKGIDQVNKTHRVKRQYIYGGIMVDVFDAGTKKSDINRIKAHLEVLGFKYTYIVGGEVPDENYSKLVFETRLKKLNPKSPGYPKIKVPKDLAEANFAGHRVVMA